MNILAKTSRSIGTIGNIIMKMGAVITEEFLSTMNFAVNGDWSVIIEAKNVSFEKLKSMHSKNRNLMLQSGSYMDCRK